MKIEDYIHDDEPMLLTSRQLYVFAGYLYSLILKAVLEDIREITGSKMVSAEEARFLLRKSRKTMRDWMHKGYLVPTKFGRLNYYRMCDILDILYGMKPDDSESTTQDNEE